MRIDFLVALFGLVVGSFLNVLIHRLPRDESPWRGRSRCTACGRTVRWFENVPLLSYAALGGRCAGCKQRISWRYPAVEALTAGLALACLHRFGPTGVAAAYFLFLATLVAIAWIDWEHQIIPDTLSLGVAPLGLVLAATVLPLGARQGLVGALAGAGFIYGVGRFWKAWRKVEAMGFGDVKLAALIGAFLGPMQMFLTVFLASFLGAVYGLAWKRSLKSQVAFGTFLAAAAAACLFYGEPLVAWYAGLLRR